MRTVLALLIVLALGWTPGPVKAQDDKAFLEGWLEKQLSSVGRRVTITGFSGALSARAHLDRLDIADDAGVWLVLEDATLDWQRSAVLRGRLEINELSAASLNILRRPQPAADILTPEARAPRRFSLPELPVAINIGNLEIDRLQLGQDILGEGLVARLGGAAQLEDGQGFAHLALERIDQKRGLLRFAGRFSNSTNRLELDLSVDEQADGILARLAHIPERPALAFAFTGAGTLPDFSGRISLQSDGVQRIGGRIEIAAGETTGDIRFQSEVSGDVRPLFVNRLRPFFGPRTELRTSATLRPDGSLAIEHIEIDTNALKVTGTLDLAPDKTPTRFRLVADVGSAPDVPVALPFPGGDTSLGHASLTADFDRATGDRWTLDGALFGLTHPALQLEELTIRAGGRITRPGQGATDTPRMTADFTARANGVRPTDPALAGALGKQLDLGGSVEWLGNRLEILRLTASDDASQVEFSGNIQGFSEGLRIQGVTTATATDLGRFARLAAIPLQAGTGRVDIDGWWQPMQGAFDASVGIQTKGLTIGGPSPYQLLAGDGVFSGKARRNTGGFVIKKALLETPEIKAAINTTLSTAHSELQANAQLRDLGRLVPEISGPATVEISMSREARAPWRVTAKGTGPGNSSLQAKGRFSPGDGRNDISVTGRFPLGLANVFSGNRFNLQGQASMDVTLRGPLAVSSFSGRLEAANARLALPNPGISLVDVRGVAILAGGSADLSLSANGARGGSMDLSGQQMLRAPFSSNLEITINDIALSRPPSFETLANGTIRLSGAMPQNAMLSGILNLSQTEIRLIPVASVADIPEITHIAEPPAVRRTRIAAGLGKPASENGAAGPGLGLDILVRSPARVFIRGHGLDAELGGEILLSGTTANVVPGGRFDLIRGRLELLGKRFDLREGSAVLRGSFQPEFRLVAATEVDDTSVQIVVSGQADKPDIQFISNPELPEDEVLALLLFGRDISSITPLQAARLAGAIASLTGEGRTTVVGQIRKRFELDDLDIVTTDDGALAARAGKYISDNAYVEITADTEGKTVIDLNLDLTPNVTLRGSASSGGETGLGVYYEKDY